METHFVCWDTISQVENSRRPFLSNALIRHGVSGVLFKRDAAQRKTYRPCVRI